MIEPVPLSPVPTSEEVPLPRAPLARVIAQVRFSPILAITRPDRVAGFQEAIREIYPHLDLEHASHVTLVAGQPPSISQEQIWRLTDRGQRPRWRISLSTGFVAIETDDYESRRDFLHRFDAVIDAVKSEFNPKEATRLGLRYIDRLTGDAVKRIREFVRSDVLGVAHGSQGLSADDPSAVIRDSITRVMTEAEFKAKDGNRVRGRWGRMPAGKTYDPNALKPVPEPSWILDLDMFTSKPQCFESSRLLKTTEGFAETLYWIFRQIVTEQFLEFYGGRV